MRYLIDKEFLTRKAGPNGRPSAYYAAQLRYELSQRNLRWAVDRGLPHESSLGGVPAVLYREDDAGNHGNFLPSSYRCIQQKAEWARRLTKAHTSAKRALLSRDRNRRELDSSNSSDALLMNIFCHPETLAKSHVRFLLGVDAGTEPLFGFKPRVPLLSGRRDCTEIDMKLGNLLIEAKLTEYDFQTADKKLIDRYQDFEEVFDVTRLEISENQVQAYQLIRGVLAAYASREDRFCVLCDARRPDLIATWHGVLSAVRIFDLRCRLLLLTWQELAGTLPNSIQLFLAEKFGIRGEPPAA